MIPLSFSLVFRDMNIITSLLSKAIGLPEPTLRLLLTILLGYPAAHFYKKLYCSQDSPKTSRADRNQYILWTGLALNFFFNSFQIVHSLVTITVSYGLCLFLGERLQNRTWAATAVWVLNAVYLLAGYYWMETDEYDITWTMTQCILCLRLMGFGFDYLDGRHPVTVATAAKQASTEDPTQVAMRQTELKKAPAALPLSFMADTPLPRLPSFSFVMAYALYPAAFAVGPQFSFSLYDQWLDQVDLELSPEDREEKERAQSAYVLRSVLLAIAYLGLQQVVGSRYSTAYLLTEDYQSLCFLKRAFFFCLAGKFAFNKYIGIWLLTEGAIASFGISYDGKDSNGLARFGGLANTDPGRFETATSIDHVISAFNINTNLWSKYYVFKRLKFLGSKSASQFGTLAFLAIWHGFHSVYFTTFLLEFLFVLCESKLRKRLVPLLEPYTEKNEIYFYAWKCLAWVTCQVTCAYGIVGFELLKFGRSWTAYKSVGFIGHLAILVIFAADNYLPRHAKSLKTRKTQ
ncbi:hypothetical protein G6F46_005199 [Rhizopus delemar]|uniref:Lysophospholipid acyltransferase 5 n=2 Tax=Rhizopus TaxID=4842 RepID=A0A9P6Z712_9FUNG|nr:hypothetical protein G6F43_007873 [Rhizopus delemar]KAG1546922.1 hypothetical protein G6F51_004577 [Rhizopus arrhizus]KAG1462228.1 hypothetical protein G6F55_003096 [Rhizopus delemar]KAG1503057.1 hypothetical protein G6F54_001933 [Rhizopus delemar]KAG1510793.1 hypothetical protein G6F53_006421 [Rhizopus delemar]